MSMTTTITKIERPARRGDRFRIPAKIRNGGFGSEKIYRVRLANGEDFEGIGFTHYMWDEAKKILPDKDLDGEISGYVMVYFQEMCGEDEAVVEPPQLHNVDYQGPIAVAKNDLQNFPPDDIK